MIIGFFQVQMQFSFVFSLGAELFLIFELQIFFN
jgi:hypothetical protein